MRVISLTNASSVQEPGTDTVHEVGPDGVFDLPADFALELTAKHASQWRLESAHEAAQAAAKVEALRSPHVLPGVVAKLREDLDAALARIEALEKAAVKPQPQRAAKKAAAEPAE